MSTPNTGRSPGRNDPCPCGSGKKYKKCHGANEAAGRMAQAAPATDQGIEQQFAQAYYQFQQGMFAPAAEICAAILRSRPSHIHANHLLGLCHYQQGHFEAALPYLERAIKLDPTDPDAQNNLAMTLGRLGRSGEAAAHARRALELDPEAVAPRATLGRILVDLRQLPEANEVVQQALALDDRNADTWRTFGELCRIQRQLPESKKAYEKALALAPDSVQVLNDYGLVLRELMDYDGALAVFQRASELAPYDADVLSNLGNLACTTGDPDAGRAYFLKALEADKTHALAYINLAGLASQQGDEKQSVEWLVRGVAACPNEPIFYEELAVAFAERQEFRSAYQKIKQAVEIGGSTASTELALAEVCDRHRDEKGARAAFSRAIELDPYSPELLLKFATFQEQSNRYDEAARLAARAIELDPSREIQARILIARAERRRRDYEKAAAELAGIDFATLPSGVAEKAWFELGSLRDARGEYKQAFDAFEKGAAATIRSGHLHFNPDETAMEFRHVREVLAPDVVKRLSRYQGGPSAKNVPIFIVGFTRSGTTLMEQILSSHPDVEAGDELLAIGKVMERIAEDVGQQYPECLVALDGQNEQEQLRRWRKQYLDYAEDAGVVMDREGFFTDKLPFNLLNLPLISMLFPESPIIHIRRNPMDCVFSNFVVNLGPMSPWAFNLEHAASYYREVLGMGEYYREHLPMRYYELRYEDLVADPESMVREVADFVGLSWDDRLLKFYESKRVARTPSHAQVNQPIYKRSVERYRHYEQYLDRPLAILEPLMRRFGYLDGKIDVES